MMRRVPDWHLDHADIAGGIIQTPGGDYEITRVIGEPTEFEEVRADLRLMAAAPSLLRAASSLLQAWREAPENPCGALPSSSAESLQTALSELRAAVEFVERQPESRRGGAGR